MAAGCDGRQHFQRKAHEILPPKATDRKVEELGAATVSRTHVTHEALEAGLHSLTHVHATTAQAVDGVDDTTHLQRAAGPVQARLVDAILGEGGAHRLHDAPQLLRSGALRQCCVVEQLVLLANRLPAEARGAGRASGRLMPQTVTTKEETVVVSAETTGGKEGNGRCRLLGPRRRHQSLEVRRRSSFMMSGEMNRPVDGWLSICRVLTVYGSHPACLWATGRPSA